MRTYSSQQQHGKKSGGGGALVALSALALAGGATLGYAKYDPDFRKFLTEYIPFTDNLLKTIFAEDGDGNILSNSYSSIKSSIVGLVSGNKQKGDRIVHSIPEPAEYKGKSFIYTA